MGHRYSSQVGSWLGSRWTWALSLSAACSCGGIFASKWRKMGSFCPAKVFGFTSSPLLMFQPCFMLLLQSLLLPGLWLSCQNLININKPELLLLLAASQEITTLMTVKYDQGRLVLAINAWVSKLVKTLYGWLFEPKVYQANMCIWAWR